MPENLKSVEAWKAAPAHVRMMAGAYVDAIIADLAALAAEVKKQGEQINELSLRLAYQGVNHESA